MTDDGDIMRGRRTLVAATVAAAALTACGGDTTSVTTDAEARQAVIDTFRSSWNAEARVDIEVTDAQVDAVLDILTEADPSLQAGLDGAGEVIEMLRTQSDTARSVAARAEDGSFRFGATLDGEDVLDLRLNLHELVAADSLTPDVDVLVRVDIATYLQQFRESFEMMARMDPAAPAMPEVPDLSQLRAQVSMFMPSGPVEDVLLAIMDGEFGGATGQLDLAALGMTQDDLDEVRDEFLSGYDSSLEPAELVAVLHDSVSIRDLAPAGGGTRGVVDFHPRAALVAIGELLEEAGEVDDHREDFAAETGMTVDEIPESIPGVATLLFDGAGHLRELTIPMLEIGRQAIALASGAPPEVDEVLSALEGARYDVVMTFTDVGEVDTVLDVDAVTAPWQEFIDLTNQYAPGLDPASTTS